MTPLPRRSGDVPCGPQGRASKGAETRGRSFSSLLRSSTALGWAAAFLAPALISSLDALSNRPSYQLAGFLYLLAVSLAAYLGGFAAGLVATVLATLGLDYFFTPPQARLHPRKRGPGCRRRPLLRRRDPHLAALRAPSPGSAAGGGGHRPGEPAPGGHRTAGGGGHPAAGARRHRHPGSRGCRGARGRHRASRRPTARRSRSWRSAGYEQNIFVGWESFPLASDTPMGKAIREEHAVLLQHLGRAQRGFPDDGEDRRPEPRARDPSRSSSKGVRSVPSRSPSRRRSSSTPSAAR